MTTEKLYWVLGDTKNGFEIRTKKPRTKFVPEPIRGKENVQRWIALQFLLEA